MIPKQIRDRIAMGVAVLGAAALIGEVVWLWPLIVLVKAMIWP